MRSPSPHAGRRDFLAGFVKPAADAPCAVPCSMCDYCMPCPYGLDVPGIFAVYNRAVSEGWLPRDAASPDHEARRLRFLRAYDDALAPLRRADHCTGCDRCSPHCPQSIDVPHELHRIDALVEGLRREGVVRHA